MKTAVFLDAGGTVFEPYPSCGEIYSSIAARHGIILQPKDLQARFSREFKARDSITSLHSYSNEPIEITWW